MARQVPDRRYSRGRGTKRMARPPSSTKLRTEAQVERMTRDELVRELLRAQETSARETQESNEREADKDYVGGLADTLGFQGALTGGADMVWTLGSAALAVLWNKHKSKEGKDTSWALGEILIGSVVAMSLAETTPVLAKGDDRIGTAPTLLNIALGVSVAGLTYILAR